MKFDYASRWGTAMLAVMVGFNLVGCGGGGGDGGDNSPNPSPIQAPAPESVSGQRVTLHSATVDSRVITFADSTKWIEDREGNNVSGTYEYQRVTDQDQNTGQVTFTDGEAQPLLVLTFHSENSGSFVWRDTGENGTFELQPINSGPPNEPPPNNGLAPSSLRGRTMFGTRTFTSTGPVGQTHVYTLTENTFHDSDPPEESDGTYVYAANGDQATLTLNYTEPKGFDGDRHEWQMTFQTETSGNFESVYTRRDGTVIIIRGNFTLE